MTTDQMRLVNDRVRSARGDSGVVSLFYLQPPPSAQQRPVTASVRGGHARDSRYLRLLEALTADVGPCLLVRAEESVITTSL